MVTTRQHGVDMHGLIEREPALNSLSAAVAAAVGGKGSCIVISGEAGVGKTTLLRRFAETQRSMSVLWGCSDALFTPRPLGPLRDMAHLLGAKVGPLLDGMSAQDRIFQAVLEALQDGSQRKLLVFEDIQWADHATFDLIKYLGRRIAFLPSVLALTFRSEETGKDHPVTEVLADLDRSATKRIVLNTLSVDGVARLAGKDHAEAENIHRITDGNPFYVTEFLANASGDKVPASVRDAVWARLQRLEPPERDVLESIAIAPSGTEDWLAEAILERPVRHILESCVAKGLLTLDHEQRYRFRHELARVATLARLTQSAQRELNAKALQKLRTRPGISPACLLHHAAGASDNASVLALAPEAAAEAVRLGAHREAAAHLRTALEYASNAPAEVQAQLQEDWAYEVGIALGDAGSALAAATKAVEIWRSLGRKDKAACNLRRLSRLHWLQGEGALANTYAEEAITELAGEPPSRELAMAYGVRSQLLMFDDRFTEAIDWSRKAIVLAEQLGDLETRVHALNNLGSSLLYRGEEAGHQHIEECLRLALANAYHEQAYRAYVNYAEYAVFARKFDLAERILAEGLAYTTSRDIDVGTYYLAGRQAQLRMEQGRFREADVISTSILARCDLAHVTRLPALLVQARVHMRTGAQDAAELMQKALQGAMATQEQQNIVPALFGMIEYSWLDGNLTAARENLERLASMRVEGLAPWDLGEFAVWWQRCAMARPFPRDTKPLHSAFGDELEKNCQKASDQWMEIGAPYDAALALLAGEMQLARAIEILDELGAVPAAAKARKFAHQNGLVVKSRKQSRGPYSAARHHALGLTPKERQVLGLLAKGMTNLQIGDQLGRSPRTVEHHVSSLLGKLNATTRVEALLRVQNEPWLLEASMDQNNS
jgi:DNA-binding CsgD family transcriptional regulator